MLRSLVSAILNAGILPWAFGAGFWFLMVLACDADWFIKYHDIGPPRMRIESGTYGLLALFAACFQAWAVALVGLVVFLASIWLDSRASHKDQAWGDYANRASGTVRIVPDLSRRLDGTDPLLLPRVYLDRLRDAEVDALLARQAAPQSRWPLLLAWAIPLIIRFGRSAVPPSLETIVSIACVLCLWPLAVWMIRRLDAQADAKAVEAIGDPATYIQALVKADSIMKEIPRRLRMSTWWLFPASLGARIEAIQRASGIDPSKRRL